MREDCLSGKEWSAVLISCHALSPVKVESPAGWQQSKWVLWPGEATPGPRGTEAAWGSALGSIPLSMSCVWSAPGRRVQGLMPQQGHALPDAKSRATPSLPPTAGPWETARMPFAGLRDLLHHPVLCSTSRRMLETTKTSWAWRLNRLWAQKWGWTRQNSSRAWPWMNVSVFVVGLENASHLTRAGGHKGQGWPGGEDTAGLALVTWLRADRFLLCMFSRFHLS